MSWSEAETAFLRTCIDKRWSRKRIGRHFPDRTLLALKSKIAWERKLMGLHSTSQRGTNKLHIPDDVIADRDRRANEYRSPSEILMGDPPFSQSALHPGNGAD